MSLFITGTGTDVGKTVVIAGLTGLLKRQDQSVCIYKPLQTGSLEGKPPADLETVRRWVGDPTLPVHCSYTFAEPVAPYAADVQRVIDPRRLQEDFQRLQREYDIVLVEGAGGVRVPIAPGFDTVALIRLLQLPVLVVTSPWLGTLNHTLLTVEALQGAQVEIRGVVISGMPAETADPAVTSLLPTLADWLPVPLLGALPIFDLQPGVFADPTCLASVERLALWPEAVS